MKAFELLSDESKFSRGALYRAKDGTACDRKQAASYCMIGAIIQSCDGDIDKIATAYSRILKILPVSLFRWSDKAGYEKVHSLLKELDI